MRIVIQRVSRASVKVADETVGKIENGLLVFLGISHNDQEEDVHWLAKKLMNLRIFNDDEGKMNLSLNDVDGEVLMVSQFTLHASTKKGNRPSFVKSANPNLGKRLYDYFIDYLNKEYKISVATGVFGAMMEIELLNDGPVTIIMDSKNKE
jgi:D-tyrosyl-tRNA(Tyr) deacylase